MKNFSLSLLVFFQLSATQHLFSQGQYTNEVLTVVDVDVIGIEYTPRLAGEMLRRELMKLNLYNVADYYDQAYIMERNNISISGCYSVYCLLEIGQVFKVDKILTGSITRINKSIVITIKIFDVKTGTWARMATDAFNDVPEQLDMMLALTIRKVLNLEIDKDLFNRLSKDVSFYENQELTNRDEISLAGPRFGVGFLTGIAREIMEAPKEEGGNDGWPVVSHIGYQFEKVFVSSGNTHALVEILPTLSGLEQGIFMPGINLLLGIRNSRTGLEFAMGYNVIVGKDKYYDLAEEKNKYKIALNSGLLVAAGKTFRSGRLNFPINAYFIPGKKDTHRFGVTFGFNIPRKNRK
ncbi:MAG: hypothetical protein IPI60_10785 [Saprospiraceae bacterium]|nr:hypothetical protein [Saprospiraceae bacterium]